MLRFIGYHGTTEGQYGVSSLLRGPRVDKAYERGKYGEYGQLGPGLYASPDLDLALNYAYHDVANIVEVYVDDAEPLTELDARTLPPELAGEYRLFSRESPWVTDLDRQTWALEYDLIVCHHSRTDALQVKVSPKAFDKVVIREYGHGTVSH